MARRARGNGRQIPSPPARGLLGHQPAYAADPLGSFRRWTDELGPVVRLRFGPTPVLLFTTPEAVTDVLVRQAESFRKAPLIRKAAGRVIGDSIFTSEGEAWSRQRALLEDFFSPSRMDAHVPVMAEEAAAMADRWASVERVAVLAETMAYSQRVAARVLFGVEATDAEVEQVGSALEVTAADFQYAVDHPLDLLLPDWLPSARRARLRSAVAVLDAVVAATLERRRAALPGSDLLGELLRLQAVTPWLTDRAIRDNAVTLLAESREDPGLLLTWSLYLLARSPDVADRVAAEASAVVGDSGQSAGELRRLPLSAAVLREALRLYPPVYGTGREAMHDCEVAGVPVRRGTVVLLSQYVMNRDPDRYPDPDAFRPERWLDRVESTLPEGAFTAFGIGSRRCLGEHMAWRVALAGLLTLVSRLRFAPVDDGAVEPAIVLSLRPSREVWLRPEPRTVTVTRLD